jgi:hypothetical protein
MNTTLIIIAAFALITVAFLGGCLGVFKTGEKEGICKYDYDNGKDL